jgi:hypothetical protein
MNELKKYQPEPAGLGRAPTVEFSEYFSDDLTGNYLKGKSARELFEEKVDDFFNDWEDNVYMAGQAGVGKTYIVDETAKKYPDVKLIKIEGSMTPFFFAKQLAVEMYMAEMSGKKRIAVYLDDINTLFHNLQMVDMFKEMLKPNGLGSFSYNRGMNIKGFEDIEAEAIEYWKSKNPSKVGFEIPFNNRVRFIMTMNTGIVSSSEVALLKPGKQKSFQESLAAVRSRIEHGYVDLIMTKETMWGWISYVVWNDPTMCEGATAEQRYEILQYMWDGWEKCNERSLRFVEYTMWKVMKKHPARKDYIARWTRHFTMDV